MTRFSYSGSGRRFRKPLFLLFAVIFLVFVITQYRIPGPLVFATQSEVQMQLKAAKAYWNHVQQQPLEIRERIKEHLDLVHMRVKNLSSIQEHLAQQVQVPLTHQDLNVTRQLNVQNLRHPQTNQVSQTLVFDKKRDSNQYLNSDSPSIPMSYLSNSVDNWSKIIESNVHQKQQMQLQQQPQNEDEPSIQQAKVLHLNQSKLLQNIQDSEQQNQKSVQWTGLSTDEGKFENNVATADKTLIDSKSVVKMTIEMVGNARLGNLMFGYASMLGIARRNGLKPILVSHPNMQLLIDTFAITTPVIQQSTSNWEEVEELHAGIYDSKVNSIATDLLSNYGGKGLPLPEGVSLKGYYQSWKYFDFIRDEILSEFRFHDRHASNAAEFITTVKRLFREPTKGQIVGIHVRRGDMQTLTAKDRGYTMATAGYIARAVRYIESRLNNSEIVYVVCSEDMHWFKENVRTDSLTKYHVVYSPNGQMSGALDLAILSRCDHIIETVGTYSWWAGYLANGITVYYADYPAKNSPIAREYNAEDHYPPHWVSMR